MAHVRDFEIDECPGGEHARLDVGTDRHDRGDGITHAELTQRLFVGGVGLHHMGEVTGVLLHPVFVGIDAEHLVAHVDQCACERGTEPAETDHDDLALVLNGRFEAAEHVVENVVSQ